MNRCASTRVWLKLLVLYLTPLVVLAQEQSAAIYGTIRASNGALLPGVAVGVTEKQTGAIATINTGPDGQFRFPSLRPGTYRVDARLAGFQSATVAELAATAGRQARVDLILEPARVAETVVVTAEAPLVDITSSATSKSVRSEEFERLPKGRSFENIAVFAGSANIEGKAGGLSVDGASGSENRFIIDGVDTTHLQYGIVGRSVLTDVIDEVQVKFGGYPAEFGGATGGVVSVITRTGTNDFRGEAITYYVGEVSGSSPHPGTDRPVLEKNEQGEAVYFRLPEDDHVLLEPGLLLGGPILVDRLWFFGAYQPQLWEQQRTVTFTNGVTKSFDFEQESHYGVLNLSGNIGSRINYKAAANVNRSENFGLFPDRFGRGNPDANYDLGGNSENDTFSGFVDFVPTDRLLIGLRGGRWMSDHWDNGIPNDLWVGFSTAGADPRVAFPEIPAEAFGDRGRGWSNIPSNIQTVRDLFTRDNLSFDVSFFPEWHGAHQFKAGVQLENLGNDVLSGYSNSRILFYWDRSYVTTTGEQVRGRYGYFRLLKIATEGQVESRNLGLYIQDSWSVNDRLTLNVGIRSEREEVPSFAGPEELTGIPETAIEFDFGDKLAPRLGFAYDLLGNGRAKLYGSYGVFYDITKLEMPRGSFGADKWVDHFYRLDSFDWRNNVCFISNNLLSDPVPDCPGGSFIEKVDRRHPSNTPGEETIDPNLKPMQSHELTIGAQYELSPTTVAGIRYTHKELIRTIEDVGINVPGIGEVFYIANPGEGIARHVLGEEFPAQPKPVRDYDGVELELTRRFANRWALHATYLYSRLWGNYSGLASSDEEGRTSPNVNRFFDLLPMSFDQDARPIYGRLGTDRPHQLKVQAQYRFDFGTSVGLSQYIGSGTPNTTQVSIPIGIPIFPFGRGDLGRNPTLSQTDLLLAHEVQLGARYGLELSVNVLNLFDEDTAIRVYKDLFEAELPLTQESYFLGFDTFALAAANDVPRNPRYGLAEAFQGPREIRFGAKLRF